MLSCFTDDRKHKCNFSKKNEYVGKTNLKRSRYFTYP